MIGKQSAVIGEQKQIQFADCDVS
ncbi:hypothetical protein SBDP1_580050 [Syntrophobacter sp. SbD1]|nr:hypothetical protein SBDP1_580050 [Syntrophobacter sp. SbD1]